MSINDKSRSAITSPSPERSGSPKNSPCGVMMAVNWPPEIGPIGAAGVGHDLRLLIGVEPACGVHDEGT